MQHPADPLLRLSLVLDERERVEAIAYIEPVMRDRFGCEPPPTTGIIILARIGAAIVGSIVIEGSIGGEPFPIETHYDFLPEDAPDLSDRASVVQGTRWIATHPGVSGPLVYAAIKLSYQLGKRYMLIEAKPYSINRLTELGVVCRPIEQTRLRLDVIRASVGESGMAYFTESPAPTLCLIELK